MKDFFVPYEIAVILKDKGFNEPCMACYDKLNMFSTYSPSIFEPKNYNTSGYCCSAPLYQQVLTWLRKVHGIQLFNDCTYYDGFHYGYKWIKSNGDYGEWWKDNDGESPDGWDTPEEALNEAIKETLKLI